ncbi:MAG: serine/threonine-protein kinase [Candidatus Eremiobacterota bacterium]
MYLLTAANRPYLLGRAGRPLSLDPATLQGRGRLTLVFKRDGWLDETRQVGGFYFNNHDRYPEAAQGPVRLTPRSDAASRVKQVTYLVSTRWPTLGLAAAALSALAWTLWRRHRVGREQAARLSRLEGYRASLDGSDPLVLSLLGRYRLLERLGEGGMAAVYRAVPDETLDESEAVAVKVMHRSLSQSEEYRKRFRREIQVLNALEHPNLVRILDFGEQDGLLYMTMEWLQGETVARRIPPAGMPLCEVLAILQPVAAGLSATHARGVVHRDLKPDNLFVTRDGRVKIMDFGVARGAGYTVATATGELMGTPAYLAPEQIEGQREPDPASDQYSLGVVAYELLTGRPPFTDADPYALVFMQVSKAPPPMTGVDPSVEAVVMRMLRKRPQDRYASVGEAVASLAQAGNSQGTGGTPPPDGA